MAVQPTRRQQQRVQRTMQRTTIAIFVEAELLQNDRIRNDCMVRSIDLLNTNSIHRQTQYP